MLKVNTLLAKTALRDRINIVLFPVSLIYICIVILTLLLGVLSGITGAYALAIVICIGIIVITLLSGQIEWLVTLLLMFRLYVDWYLGLGFVALALQIVFLAAYLLSRGSRINLRMPG